MILEFAHTVGGSILISDADEDAPLIKIEFFNEAKELTESQRERIGRAILTALGAESIGAAMGD